MAGPTDLASAIRARRVLSASIRARRLPDSQRAKPGLVLVASLILQATPEFEAKHPRDDDGQFASGPGTGGGDGVKGSLAQPLTVTWGTGHDGEPRAIGLPPGLPPSAVDLARTKAMRRANPDKRPEGPERGTTTTLSESDMSEIRQAALDDAFADAWSLRRKGNVDAHGRRLWEDEDMLPAEMIARAPQQDQARAEFEEAAREYGLPADEMERAWNERLAALKGTTVEGLERRKASAAKGRRTAAERRAAEIPTLPRELIWDEPEKKVLDPTYHGRVEGGIIREIDYYARRQAAGEGDITAEERKKAVTAVVDSAMKSLELKPAYVKDWTAKPFHKYIRYLTPELWRPLVEKEVNRKFDEVVRSYQ